MNKKLEDSYKCNGQTAALSSTGILPQLQQFMLINNRTSQSEQALLHIPELTHGVILWPPETENTKFDSDSAKQAPNVVYSYDGMEQVWHRSSKLLSRCSMSRKGNVHRNGNIRTNHKVMMRISASGAINIASESFW